MTNEWKCIDELAAKLQGLFGGPPGIAVALGSGLADAALKLNDSIVVDTAGLKNWPASTVEGHRGRLCMGFVGGIRTMFLQGRVHLYEGYSPAEVVRPLRAAIAWGARIVVLTNAAGAVDEALSPGELMLIEDHLNLTGCNPLVGPSDEKRGPRFPDMTELYDSKLRSQALDTARDLGVGASSGVYAGMLGPSYETPAEVRMLSRLGANAVGMSTVLEAIAAKHMGAGVLGISCITNMAAGRKGAILDHGHVQSTGKSCAEKLARLLGGLIPIFGEVK